MDGSMGSRCRVEGRRFSGNSGCEADRLFEERASSKSSAPRGENIEAGAAGQGRPRGSGIQCRDGAGADGIRVRTASSPRGLGPEGILDADTLACVGCISGPHRRARKIGVQTAPAARFVPVRCSAVSLRPEPVPSARGRCIGCAPGEIPARSLATSTDRLHSENARTPLNKPVPTGLLGVKPTPTTATPTPTTAISCRRRLNRPRRPYLRLQNPKNEGLWSM